MTLPESWLALPRAASGTLDLFGLLGLLCGLATGLMPTRRLILLSSALCSVCFSLHFWRLGSTTGMAMNLIGVTQSLLAARYVTVCRSVHRVSDLTDYPASTASGGISKSASMIC